MNNILGKILALDAQPELPEALKKLKGIEYKIVALTNGGKQTVDKQPKNAKLENNFDAVYSVKVVGKFKPHPAPYK